ncbi:4Fe-4S binding protein [Megalodesulfovibrio gigas]|uniref:Putative iron-sulfur-binding protein n=1 Tax=Megalodesulfovibrio gigas (strain ATCC 19364 / DSM 1382 / NCIMB 9332 / VKM B-1759) TaxID=1121448 RepID=T2G8Y5_MEGG1|nr:4Fe-4S dicluster domain-containing protein [Megalodesulfovibrio gigas]AGW13050.1 putative iron-sulfur-binding protein [Megalodesulfovibrio gigas DSM 1382 = ATCC 19364]
MHRITPLLVTLALLLFAAHTLRLGDLGLVAALLGCIALAWTRWAWARWTLTAVLGWGAVVWVQTGSRLVAMRLAMDAPWERLALIMAAVTLVTVAAMGCLHLPAARRRHATGAETAAVRAGAVLLTALLLGVARAKAGFPILLLDRFAPGWGWLQIAGMAWYAGWLAQAVLDPRRHRRWRPWLWAGFSALFFGQLLLGLAGWTVFLMTGTLHLPVPALILGGPLFRGEGLFMLILFLSTVVLVGPAWCSHLCYIGAWDDQASRRAGRIKGSAGRWIWLGRGATLALTVIVALGLRAAGVPGTTAVWIAAGFGLLGVGAMLALSTRMGSMIHCTTLCPMGLVGNLLGRCTPWRMAMGQGCTRCGACSRVCRYGALETADIERGRAGLSCTLCGDCVAVCRHAAMEYRCTGLSAGTARRVFIVLVISLHAAFAAVARL